MIKDNDCPKCGNFARFAYGEDSAWHGPVYRRESVDNDFLEYTCRRCGYVAREACRDAPKEGQP